MCNLHQIKATEALFPKHLVLNNIAINSWDVGPKVEGEHFLMNPVQTMGSQLQTLDAQLQTLGAQLKKSSFTGKSCNRTWGGAAEYVDK